jgi:Outer membrane protein beta-barrel domain
MKKLKLLLVLISFSTITKSQIHFGVKAGLNLANQRFDSTSNTSYISDFNVGVLASIPITKSLSLQPELMLSVQGYGEKYNDTSYRVTHGYFLLPILLKYSLNSGVFAEMGPQFGFSVDKLYIQPFDFSWSFGVGYKLPVNLGIDIRYNLGISNVEKYSTVKAYNSVFQFDLYYLFGK